jgi:hypothetical protein
MTAIAALGPFVALVGFLTGIRERRDDRVRAALSSLGKALVETRLYLRDQERGGKQDTDREDDLVRRWADTASALYALDTHLADVCEHKSRYWMEPAGWSEHDVRAKGIAIDCIYETYGTLLRAREAKLDRGID